MSRDSTSAAGARTPRRSLQNRRPRQRTTVCSTLQAWHSPLDGPGPDSDIRVFLTAFSSRMRPCRGVSRCICSLRCVIWFIESCSNKDKKIIINNREDCASMATAGCRRRACRRDLRSTRPRVPPRPDPRPGAGAGTGLGSATSRRTCWARKRHRPTGGNPCPPRLEDDTLAALVAAPEAPPECVRSTSRSLPQQQAAVTSMASPCKCPRGLRASGSTGTGRTRRDTRSSGCRESNGADLARRVLDRVWPGAAGAGSMSRVRTAGSS